jgi:hypothetical protein
MAIRSDYTQAMTEKLYDWFYEKYDPLPIVYKQVFDVQPSKAAYEAQVTGVGTGRLQETDEMGSIQYRDPMEGYPVYGRNRTFTDGIKFSKETVDDFPKQYIENILKETIQGDDGWANGVKDTEEDFYSNVFNYGGLAAGHSMFNASVAGFTDPSGNFIYDGKPLFNLNTNLRSSKGGGTYYNHLGAAALTAANLKAAFDLITATNNKNERDLKKAIIPDTLLIPPALKWTAEELLKSEKEPWVTTNTTNVLRNIVNIVIWHYLTDTDAWFLGCAKKGLVALMREEPLIDYFQDEDTKAYKANIWVRWGLKITNWRYWVCANLTT